MKRHVALVGFMGAGKSTIGRKLARKLRCAFFDTDDLIAREHGAVAAIFACEGEPAFRRYERDAIAKILASGEAGIVALGGGALTVAENRKVLKKHAYRIFLRASPEQILARVRSSAELRPLLGPVPTMKRIRELYEARLPQYAGVDYVVEAARMTDRQILDDILSWLREKNVALT